MTILGDFGRRVLCVIGLALSGLLLGTGTHAAPAHGIAMYGQPALPPDFVSLPYANPDAPQGGEIVFGEAGGFDSLNPFILKGRAPAGLSALTVETLMGRSYAEPFTLYGLLAESVLVGAQREWVEFTLRPNARFADGAPVTIEDVIWSFETLGTQGHPRYLGSWKKVANTQQTGPRSVRFTFNEIDRELPLILGLRPILQKAQWAGRAFDVSSLEAPIGSGPYIVDRFEPGRSITYRKNPNWWGQDLAFNRGHHNFETIRYDYFGDASVIFEAFKSGALSSYRESSVAKWARNYDFPAIASGAILKSEVPHQRPSGINGLAFNTRRPLFFDWRVREALILAFNFEFINNTLNAGALPRIRSYFSNSALAMGQGPATGRVAAALAPFADSLLPDTFEGYVLPKSDGSEANRTNTRRAAALLREAGWQVTDGQLRDVSGRPFTFEVLLAQGADEAQSIVTIYAEALKRLGITVRVSTVDAAQYVERTNTYDFDMTPYVRALSLSPGNEQMLYWGHEGVTQPGSRNWMGIDSPAAEAMIARMLSADDQQDFIAAARALDRILTAGRYVIPFWYSDVSRLAHKRVLKFPGNLPIYGDWIGFQPDVWWYEE